MNKDEALKLALEALEMFCEHGAILRPIETRDAIKEALAQPWPDLTEQQHDSYQKGHNDGVAHHKQAVNAAQPEQQGWKPTDEDYKKWCDQHDMQNPTSRDAFDDAASIYLTATPPKREWVGLTIAQFVEAARLAEAGNYLVAFQRIQQWIKEKNK